MTVVDHVSSFAIGAAVAVAGVAVAIGAGAGAAGAIGAGAAGAAITVVGVVVAAGAAVRPREFKPLSAVAGSLTSFAAIAFAASQFGGSAPELPAEPPATAPATTLTVEGKCADAQTRVVGKGGNVFHLILPPGCALKL